MNIKSLFLTIALVSTSFSPIAISAFESEMVNWAKRAIVPHLKDGSRALGTDLKIIGNAVASAAQKSAKAGFEMGNKCLECANSVMDTYPRTTTFFGAYAVMLAGLIAYDYQKNDLRNYQINELQKLAHMLNNVQVDQDGKLYTNFHGVLYDFPEGQFSTSVQNAIKSFEKEYYSNADFSPLSQAYTNLITVINAEIAWLYNPKSVLTIPLLSFALAWGIMGGIACHKDGWPQKLDQCIKDYVKSFAIFK